MYKWMITLGLFVALVGCNGEEETKTKTDIKQEKPKVSEQASPKVQEQPAEQKAQPTEEAKPEEPKQESKQSNAPVQEAVKPKASKPEPVPASPPPSSSSVPSTQSTPSTPSTLPPPQPAEPVKQAESVFLTIRGAGNTILGKTEVELENGDTVFSVLARTVKKKGIQMEYSGAGASIYIEGINNLYEKDKGPLSGWIYKRNGVQAKTGAGKTAVKTGDVIEWVYTVDGENP
ncbi:DUF4430 domain-containing protein [Ectobacillus sp. JY-23]|uniref:DUF4430 domain-containing protein n=1 Tax=Ectobacillus sp. JY-23 TaxID=2933872 RepID=UPI001FF12592|nr:DUF4430 domain-containing protein [Ectobacillus sp. JY-23]UOY93064.1 DUF4430 domain-containing protein [Ectobacillus sp. JY-23]